MAKPTMSDYVAETAKVVRRQISQRPEKPLVEAFLSNPRHVIRIIACGSSRNAAELSRPYLRHILGREVLVTEPRAFCEYEHQLVAREFCVVISQSGYSTNALDALRCLRDLGEAPLGITGDVASDFSQLADPLIDYGVGEELVGYVTKGVTSLTTFLALFGIGVAEREGRLSEAEASREREDIESLMEGFEEIRVATPLLLERRYKELSSMGPTFFCGSGPNYGLAREGVLKYAECLQIPAFALELEEFLHGPNLQINPRYTLFLLALGQRSWNRTQQIAQASRTVTDHVFVITDAPAETGAADIRITRRGPELLAPLQALPFFQLTAWQLTEDEHLWHKHPLVARFDAELSGKSENYVDKEVL